MFKEAKELLDKHAPGWARKVNLRTLNMRSCKFCVLGQVFGEFISGLRTLEIPDERAQALGFDRTAYWTYPRLNVRWNRFIKSVRRGGRIG